MSERESKSDLQRAAEVVTFVCVCKAPVAQLVEQKTLNLLVEGSNPSGGTIPARLRVPLSRKPTMFSASNESPMAIVSVMKIIGNHATHASAIQEATSTCSWAGPKVTRKFWRAKLVRCKATEYEVA